MANAVFSGDDREIITVDLETQEYLVQAQEDLLLRPVTDEERQGIIDNYVEEEMLVSEAQSRGFDNSSRIRSLMIQNMRFFLAQNIPEPSDADIEAHFENYPERFTTEPAVTYEHILYRDPKAAPEDVVDRLREGANFREFGNQDGSVQPLLHEVDERSIAATFGPEVGPEVLAIDDDGWHGPFVSDSGVHFLRVRERHPARSPAFEDIRNWVENDWLLTMSRQTIDEALEEMSDNYIVVVETAADASP